MHGETGGRPSHDLTGTLRGQKPSDKINLRGVHGVEIDGSFRLSTWRAGLQSATSSCGSAAL